MDGPPFRAEHVGSLLRPKSLTGAFRKLQAGEIDADGFHAAQEAAIREAVALQEEVGLKVVTDGEFRRISYWGHFLGPVGGLTAKESVYRFRNDAGEEQAFLAPHVEGKVARRQAISHHELAFLLSVTHVTAKITLPSPPTFHFWRGDQGIADAYADAEAFFADFTQVYREELADLAAAGARYVQLDEVPLAMLCDPEVREAVRARGEDPDALEDLYVRSFQEALRCKPAGLTVGLHLCRGNHHGKYLSAGGYGPVAERLFNEIPVDAYFLEYDTARAGGFEPLAHLPEGKRAILGLVSSKTAVLEDPDSLVRRLEEAARHTDLDRLGISPQCGFASSVGGNPITILDEKNKLRLVVDVATRVWGRA